MKCNIFQNYCAADIGSEDTSKMGVSCLSGRASTSQTLPSTELIEEGKQSSVSHGIILIIYLFINNFISDN